MSPSSSKRRPVQLTLDQARRPTGHGGWRPRAGRPRGKATCSHATRPAFAASAPIHVTLRIVGGLPSLRRERIVRAVRAVIAAGGHRDDFRVVHFNVLGNHLHLIIEAAGAPALVPASITALPPRTSATATARFSNSVSTSAAISSACVP